ncbi:hypothetical protein L9F63_001881 [Diploptera punctata]|uniref:Aminopeptidase N n=1 Tax=Diploptera punctata TaxID=6984 RepID=A0AAD8A4C1_DIPPU|nr:hypothetical protein L9F63_001881 [Diploptera punctata]
MRTAACLLLLASLVAGEAVFRLPRNVFPIDYTIKIIVDLGSSGDYTFKGEVSIQVECKSNTEIIKLHSKELEISDGDVTVTSVENNTNLLGSQSYELENDFYILHLTQPLQDGHKYTIYIPFQGNLTEGLAGFYRSSYVDRATNRTRWLAVTQFESHDARRAFPCFDEPEFKAKFQVTLGHHKEYKSASNMPINYTGPMEGKEDWLLDHFQLSEKMSTYLLAFLVSDMEYRESKINNVNFRTWARRDALPQTEFASEIGPQVLHFYEEFFKIKYPLPKQDMVAIPDFSSGAMENWGLITYRESALLYDPNATSLDNKKSIAGVIAHELAHQWFGNLVTMKWWSDIWLNEGFATYVSTLGVQHVNPEWNALDIDAVGNMLTVFAFDSLNSSHPVFVPIDQPSKIQQIFDAISYKKGSFLLRMMSLFLGEDVFRRGLTMYLTKHKFSNAEQDDLWQCLTEVAHESNVLPQDMTVKMVMDTWTVQTGYPIITIKRDYENGTAHLSQERYIGGSGSEDKYIEGSGSEDNPCWIIPLTYTTQTEKDFETTLPRSWFTCNSTSKEVSGLPTDDHWVIFNVKIAGLYRINYDDKNWELISNILNSDKFNTIANLNRVQLVEDSMNLAWEGILPYKTTIRLLTYLQHETEYLPLSAAFSNFKDLDKMLRRTLAYGTFREYLRKLLTPIYRKTGNITDIDKLSLEGLKLKRIVVSWSCLLQMGDCVEQTRDLFNAWKKLDNPDVNNPIPLDLKSTVYCSAIRYGGEKEWRYAWDRYLSSNLATEKNNLMYALSCTRERWLLQRFLHLSVDETSGIRRQDSINVFTDVASNDVGFEVAKQFLKQNLDTLYKYHGPKASRLGRLISVLAAHMFTEEEFSEMQKFLEKNDKYLKQSNLSVKRALETIQSNIRWHKNQYQPFLDSVQYHSDTNNVKHHSNETTISQQDGTVTSVINKIILIETQNYENDFHVVKFFQLKKIQQKYTLYIPFKEKLINGLNFFYKCNYVDKTSNDIRIGRYGWEWTTSYTTPCMPTHLVEFMMSNLYYELPPQIPGTRNIIFRIWGRKDTMTQLEFAGDCSQVLSFYEKYFCLAFNLPTQDMGNIQDFDEEAMEDCPLIINRHMKPRNDLRYGLLLPSKYMFTNRDLEQMEQMILDNDEHFENSDLLIREIQQTILRNSEPYPRCYDEFIQML